MNDVVEGEDLMGSGREVKGEFSSKCRYMCKGPEARIHMGGLSDEPFVVAEGVMKRRGNGERPYTNTVPSIHDTDLEFYPKGLGKP